MKLLLQLYLEFFRTGLFSVGGGMATVPFLQDIGARTGWFTNSDLTMMIAVSESTPGPIGINMATYVGYQTAGPVGSFVSTLGLVTPSILVILIVARVLQKFRQSWAVNSIFSGLRPASTALITSAGITVALAVYLPEGAALTLPAIRWPCVALSVVIFLAMKVPKLNKLHPILFIAISAVAGILLQL